MITSSSAVRIYYSYIGPLIHRPGPDHTKVFQRRFTLDFTTLKFLTGNFLIKFRKIQRISTLKSLSTQKVATQSNKSNSSKA